MKIILLSLFFCISNFSLAQAQQNILRDKNGFVVCFESKNKTYFIDWDHFIQTSIKNVSYFEMTDFNRTGAGALRGCKDQKYIHEVPSEILRSVDEMKNEWTQDVLFSIQQVSEGAHTFRKEKSAADYIKNRIQTFQPDHPEVLTQLRAEVGDRFASEVMNLFISQIIDPNKSCSTYIGTCDFYLCQEQKNPCGLDNYNLHFGYKYCSGSKFNLLNKMKTEDGKNWTRGVFTCLQKRSLENSEKLSGSENMCLEIKSTSYDSHPDCYFEAGFCNLKLSEKEKIFTLIKKEIFSAQTIKQGVELLKMCGDQKRSSEEELLLKK